LGPATNTSSWILSNKILTSLRRRGLVQYKMAAATGAWEEWHTSDISWWTVTPRVCSAEVPWDRRLSWATSGLDFSYVPGWRHAAQDPA
jgi:hypothetical protein